MVSRRALFRQLAGKHEAPRRPPWTGDNLTDRCTRCNDCIEACPEQVLFRGDGGFPEIDFSAEGCTFCGDCASACEADVFDLSRQAFPWTAVIRDQCLAYAGIACQSCQDACEPRAIRFSPQLGGVPQPQLDEDACTGCGACLSSCPTHSISLEISHG